MKILVQISGMGLAAAFCIFGLGLRQARQLIRSRIEQLRKNSNAKTLTMNFKTNETLPLPVRRYFRFALGEGQHPIREAQLKQKGILRISPKSDQWIPFEAIEYSFPFSPGFIWDARVRLFPGFHLQVLDSYVSGKGSGQVRVLSSFRVSEGGGELEMNSGSLHRYLAESAWYPTALLPQKGVRWFPIGDSRARVTLSDNGIEVSLEVLFNSAGELISIFTPERWGSFDGGFKKVAWEGRFHHYIEVSGMKVPSEGEVGWYVDGKWQSVWKGELVEAKYSFE